MIYRFVQLLITDHQPANYKLCFLFEEKLFGLLVDLNKIILAAFILLLVRHQEKTNLNGEPTKHCSLDSTILDKIRWDTLPYGREKAASSPFPPFQCCSYVVKNFFRLTNFIVSCNFL